MAVRFDCLDLRLLSLQDIITFYFSFKIWLCLPLEIQKCFIKKRKKNHKTFQCEQSL